MLRWMAGASLVPILGCQARGVSVVGDDDDSSTSSSSTSSGSCAEIPQETGGPYPADGTNGPNALTTSGIVRSDIRTSFGSLSGTAPGIATGISLTIILTVVDASNGCTPLPAFAVYLWHCDQNGKYSLYDLTTQNYLRGVQVTDDDGKVTFQSIFPACYSGRWPHIHFEVYASEESATSGKNAVKTSQLAMPKSTCDLVYATDGYEQSVTNLAKVSLTSDNVFSDGVSLQTPTISGNAETGFAATLAVAVKT